MPLKSIDLFALLFLFSEKKIIKTRQFFGKIPINLLLHAHFKHTSSLIRRFSFLF